MRMLRKLALLMLFGSLLGVVLPATSGAATDKPVRGGILTIAGNNVTTNYEANAALSQAYGFITNYLIFGSLLTQEPNGTFGPGEALGYTISPNKMIFTLHLRKGLTFQDGTPFNAAAVVWNMQKDENPATGCLCYPSMQVISGQTAPNPTKVVVYLKQPDAAIPALFWQGGPAYNDSPTAFNAEGASQFGVDPIGAGPFKVASISVNVNADLVRFDKYWDAPRPYLAGVDLPVYTQTSTAYSALQAGQAQLDNLTDPPTLSEARSNPNVKLLSSGFYNGGGGEILVNSLKPPFNNLAARQALAYAIDFPPINKEVYGGLNRASESDLVPGEPGYFGPKTPGFLSYNLAKAKALVSSVGGISFTQTCSSNVGVALASCEGLAQDFEAAGMNVTLNPVAIHSTYVTDLSSANYQIMTSISFPSTPDPALTLPTYFGSSGGNTAFLPTGTPLQGWLNQAAATYTPSKRAALYEKIWEYVVKNVYVIPTAQTGTVLIRNDNLKGIGAGPLLLTGAYFQK